MGKLFLGMILVIVLLVAAGESGDSLRSALSAAGHWLHVDGGSVQG